MGDNFTPLIDGDNADAATFNAVFAEFDTVIGPFSAAIDVGSAVSNLVEAANALRTQLGDVSASTVPGSPASWLEVTDKLMEILGISSLANRILEWAEGGAFKETAISYHSTLGVKSGSTGYWPDGSAGVWTTTAYNTTYRAIEAFTITHVDSGLTVTQAAPTRDEKGDPTVRPLMTIA